MSETNEFSFRTVVGGFHKGDVSQYITKTAAAHRQEVSELQEKIAALEAEMELLRRKSALVANLPPEEAAPVEEPEVALEPQPAQTHEVPQDSRLQQRELEAYRRAEATERLAYQRAKKLYGNMQAICDRSADTLSETDQTAKEAMDTITTQLSAISGAVEALYASIRTSSEELRAMGQILPEPADELEEV